MGKTSHQNLGNKASALGHMRVLDMAGHSGQYCTKLLADLGADVIKIEPPEGDPLRYLAPFVGDVPHHERGLHFLGLNTNKRSIVLDLNSQSDRDDFRKLVTTADVLVETSKPGYLSSLGIGYGDLSSINPALVFTSVTPFGQTGPYSRYAGGELIAQAMGGLMYIQGDDEKPPCMSPCYQAYHLASLHAAYATLVALHDRRETGLGQHVDVSLQEVVASLLFTITRYATFSDIVRRTGLAPPMTSTNHYQCKDGRVTLAVYFVNHWKTFAQWANNELLRDPIWEDIDMRVSNADVIDDGMAEFAMGLTQRELIEGGLKHHLAVVPIHTIADFVTSPHTQARKFFIDAQHPSIGKHKLPGAPYRLSETPWKLRRSSPLLGEHLAQVMEEAKKLPQKRPKVQQEAMGNDLPLSGVRVLDFSRVWSAPLTTRLMGDFGAEIIRIETADVLDAVRRNTGRNYQFPELNRSKMGATVDFKTPEGVELIKMLAKVSDIVIENYSRGVIERSGLGYDEFRKMRPDIIMMSMPALGNDGPHADYLAYGLQIMSYIGMADIWGYPESSFKARSKVHYPDFVSGATGAVALMAALEYRNISGRGQYIELAQAEAVAATMETAFMDHFISGRTWGPEGNRDMNASPHGCYPCQGDDTWCAIACYTEEEWLRLCEVMGHPEWTREEKFSTKDARLNNQAQLDEMIAQWTREYTPHQAMRLLQESGVPAGAVQTGEDLYRDIHLRDRDFIVEVSHSDWGRREHTGLTARLSRSPGRIERGTPAFGEHNRYVFTELLGLSDKEFEGLVRSGVIK